MNDNLENKALVLALACIHEALKALNNHQSIDNKLEKLLMNDQEAQAKLNEIIASNTAIVTAVTDISGDLAEASTEINARITELQTTIDELSQAATGLSPELQALIDSAAAQSAEVSASLAPVQTASQALADIVPNAPTEPTA